MHLDELLGDAESQPGAAELAGDRPVRLLELCEQLTDPLRGNPDPGVRHPETQHFLDVLDGNLDPPPRRVNLSALPARFMRHCVMR